MLSFGQMGAGVFAAPTSIRETVEAMYSVITLSELPSVKESIYAVVMQGRKENPVVRQVLYSSNLSI